MRPAGSLIILGFSLMSCVSGPPSHADEVYAAVLAQVHTLENLTQPVLVHPDMLSHHTGPADPWDQVEFYSEHPTDAIGRAARLGSALPIPSDSVVRSYGAIERRVHIPS